MPRQHDQLSDEGSRLALIPGRPSPDGLQVTVDGLFEAATDLDERDIHLCDAVLTGAAGL